MTSLDPALIRMDRARLWGARPEDASRLGRALDQLTPASIGLSPRETLIVRRLAVRTPLPRTGPADGFVACLRDDLRARLVSAQRGRTGDGEDLFFEDEADLEAAIVEEWLHSRARISSRSWLHLVDASAPLTRWRKHVLPDRILLARVIVRLVMSGNAEAWLDRFETAEISSAAARLLDGYGAAVAPVEDEVSRPADTDDLVQQSPAASTAAIHQAISTTAPEARRSARPERRRLVALAFIIVRRPALIATHGFVESLDQFATVITPANRTANRATTLRGTLAKPLAAHLRADCAPAADNRPRRVPPQAAKPSPSGHIEPKTNAASAVHTNFGGLFFLLNAFLALRLYGDFTRPADTLKGPSPFELMYLLGAKWFGTQFESDPLAPLLCKLASLQPDEKPGNLFDPPPWSVPNFWLTPWADAETHQFYFPLTAEPGSPATRKRQWIDNLARYLTARLRRALDDPDAVAITCTQPARITLRRDHIDIRFPLADHPISLRFAGLDRDPGWVPAAAHFIAFSFT